jgi:hypothetical protein
MLRDKEVITLRRLTSPTNVEVTCRAHITAGGRNDAEVGTGGVTQFVRRVVISNTEIAAADWPGPPRRGDQIVRGGDKTLAVQTCDTAVNGLDTVMHTMTTLGA